MVRLYDAVRGDMEGSTMTGIAALGIAVVYLLILVAGAVVALLVLVWLFGDAPGVSARTGHRRAGVRPAPTVSGREARPRPRLRAGPTARWMRPPETTRAGSPDQDPDPFDAEPLAKPRSSRPARGRADGAREHVRGILEGQPGAPPTRHEPAPDGGAQRGGGARRRGTFDRPRVRRARARCRKQKGEAAPPRGCPRFTVTSVTTVTS
jgi:hypothetical protein